MNKKVIIFGATGKTGIKICEQLQELQIPHSALVRKGSEAKITTKDTNLVSGNVLHKEDVENALKSDNYTDVIIALGSRDLKKTLIRSDGTKNIVDALSKLSQKSKIHVISALGVGKSWSQLNWFGKLICKVLISNTMTDHNIQEEIVTSSSLEFHIVRPVGLTDGELSGNVICKNEGTMPSDKISRADVALYLVESMVDNKSGFSSICKLGK